MSLLLKCDKLDVSLVNCKGERAQIPSGDIDVEDVSMSVSQDDVVESELQKQVREGSARLLMLQREFIKIEPARSPNDIFMQPNTVSDTRIDAHRSSIYRYFYFESYIYIHASNIHRLYA